ncbi:response regulator transcription factor [Spirosoma gilvum]
MKILIVEDEIELATHMAEYLSGESQFLCELAPTYETASEKIHLYDYDCILLDITLPDGSGLQLLQELKKANKTEGVIIISAKNSLDDRIAGLDMGADDYLTKPFHFSELSSRVNSIIRRRKFDGSNLVKLNEITVNLTAKTITVNQNELYLSRKEYDLFMFLTSNRNRIVSKNSIAEHLSGDEADLFDNYDVIYAHMKNLKKKLADAGARDYIRTVYGVGYKFSLDEAA